MGGTQWHSPSFRSQHTFGHLKLQRPEFSFIKRNENENYPLSTRVTIKGLCAWMQLAGTLRVCTAQAEP